MLRCILCIPWHRMYLINRSWDTLCVLAYIGWVWWTNWDASCVLAGMGGHKIHTLRCILCSCWRGLDLVNISRYAFSELVDGWCVWSKLVEVLFCPRWHEMDLVITRWDSLCLRWQGRGLVNTWWDAICVVTGAGGIWSTQVEMHFVSSMAWEGFGQHM
jgi:hypothetical protein